MYEAVKPGDGEPSLPMIRLKGSQTAHLLGKGPAAARKRKQGESRPVPQGSCVLRAALCARHHTEIGDDAFCNGLAHLAVQPRQNSREVLMFIGK